MEEIVNNEPSVESVPVVKEVDKVEEPVVEVEIHEPSVEPVPVTEESASVEEVTEEVEASETKEGVINRLKQIADSDDEINRQEADSLKSRFYRILKLENDEAFKKYVEAGGDAEKYEPIIDPMEQIFKDQFAVVREKRAAQHEAQEHKKEENYLKKVQIIEKIKAILENPDEVNKLYNEFRNLHAEWNNIKDVPAEKATELWKAYQMCVEKFYDTLKLNNEFRAYDFKKNLEMKTAICETAEKLAEETDIISAFRQLQNLHQQFREIGPVSRELREEVWNRFKEASTIINKRHQDYFESRKEDENNNLDQKAAICEIIESYDIDSLKTFAGWNDISDKIIALQAKWKTIGFAPQKMNQKIYDRFRAACDAFFKKKEEFFKGVRESLNENLKNKQILVEKAEALKDSQEWKKTADALINLQKEWATIGAVPKKHSEELWARFRAACDAFFAARKANGSNQYSEQNDNLHKKKAIVARLEAIIPEKADDLRQTLKDAQAEWNEIGHVPFKEKDIIYKALRTQMDRLYDYLGEAVAKRRTEHFKSSFSDGKGGSNNKLRDRLQRQAEILQQEIKTYENNLGFLNLSKGNKGGNSLIDDLGYKVEKLKSDLKEVKDKIDIIDTQE